MMKEVGVWLQTTQVGNGSSFCTKQNHYRPSIDQRLSVHLRFIDFKQAYSIRRDKVCEVISELQTSENIINVARGLR